jgi:hypothetical protein
MNEKQALTTFHTSFHPTQVMRQLGEFQVQTGPPANELDLGCIKLLKACLVRLGLFFAFPKTQKNFF